MSTDAPTALDLVTTVRHGVPHVVAIAPGPVRARLVFRVGVVDESVPERGLTHLVEHLVMRAVGRRHIEVNGHTGVWTTGFEAVGPAADVTAFVEDVWRALADLPTEALDLERTILHHEAAGAVTSPAVESAHHRFGVTGPGRLWTDELGLGAADAESVRAWAGAHLVRGAAALASTAEITPDLSADLGPEPAPGAPVARPLPVPVRARGGRGPVWVGDAGGTAVSLLLPSAHGTDLLVGRLLADAAHDEVRHARALAYEVGMDALPVTPDLTDVAVYAACDPDEHAEVAGLLVGLVRRLRDHGPDEAALDLERRRSRSVWTDVPDHLEVAAEAAVHLLVGRPPTSLADRLADVEAMGVEQVRDAVREAWPSLQVLLPVEQDPQVDGVQECTHDDPPVTGRVHRGNPLAGLLPGARIPLPPSASLTRGEAGLTLRLDGEASTVRWDQVAAVVRQPHALTVLGHDGTSLLVPDGTFLGGGAVRREVEARVDPVLFVDAVD